VSSTPCQCIGCGCDDDHACADLLGDPCAWLIQSQSGRLGVCSECPAMLAVWNSGKRYFTARAKTAIAERRLLERTMRSIGRSSHYRKNNPKV
jgi:hypothetical protein